MAASPSSSSTDSASVLSSSSIYSSKFSDGESVYMGEPLPYQFEPELSLESDNIPVDELTEVTDNTGSIDRVGNIDW